MADPDELYLSLSTIERMEGRLPRSETILPEAPPPAPRKEEPAVLRLISHVGPEKPAEAGASWGACPTCGGTGLARED